MFPPRHTDAATFQPFSAQQARVQGLGDGGSGGSGGSSSSGSFDTSGQRHSTSPSPTTKARSRRRGGKHAPPDLIYDDDEDGVDGGGGSGDDVVSGVFSSGGSRSSSPVDLPWCHDPSREKGSPLDDKAERRCVRREGSISKPLGGHASGVSAGRVDTRRASRDLSCKGCVSWI